MIADDRLCGLEEAATETERAGIAIRRPKGEGAAAAIGAAAAAAENDVDAFIEPNDREWSCDAIFWAIALCR